MNDEPEKSAIPTWAWLLAFFLYPIGMFVALSAGRAISWFKAALLGIGSHLILLIFIAGMIRADEVDPPPEFRALILLGMAIYLIAIGHWHYHIGDRAEIWTEREKKSWRRAGLFSVFIVIAAALGPALMLIAPAIAGRMP